MRGSDAVYDQDTEVDQTEEEHHTRPDPSRYLHVANRSMHSCWNSPMLYKGPHIILIL